MSYECYPNVRFLQRKPGPEEVFIYLLKEIQRNGEIKTVAEIKTPHNSFPISDYKLVCHIPNSGKVLIKELNGKETFYNLGYYYYGYGYTQFHISCSPDGTAFIFSRRRDPDRASRLEPEKQFGTELHILRAGHISTTIPSHDQTYNGFLSNEFVFVGTEEKTFISKLEKFGEWCSVHGRYFVPLGDGYFIVRKGKKIVLRKVETVGSVVTDAEVGGLFQRTKRESLSHFQLAGDFISCMYHRNRRGREISTEAHSETFLCRVSELVSERVTLPRRIPGDEYDRFLLPSGKFLDLSIPLGGRSKMAAQISSDARRVHFHMAQTSPIPKELVDIVAGFL